MGKPVQVNFFAIVLIVFDIFQIKTFLSVNHLVNL